MKTYTIGTAWKRLLTASALTCLTTLVFSLCSFQAMACPTGQCNNSTDSDCKSGKGNCTNGVASYHCPNPNTTCHDCSYTCNPAITCKGSASSSCSSITGVTSTNCGNYYINSAGKGMQCKWGTGSGAYCSNGGGSCVGAM